MTPRSLRKILWGCKIGKSFICKSYIYLKYTERIHNYKFSKENAFFKKKKKGRSGCRARRARLNISQAHRPPDANTWLTGKDPDAGKNWRQKEKRVTEDEMVGWHHQCNGYELGQTPEYGKEQGSLVCCSPWGHKESDMTWLLNNNNNNKLTGTLRPSWSLYFMQNVKKTFHFLKICTLV